MYLHDCPKCGTKGVLIMDDGRCPHCKSPFDMPAGGRISDSRTDVPAPVDSAHAELGEHPQVRINQGNVECPAVSVENKACPVAVPVISGIPAHMSKSRQTKPLSIAVLALLMALVTGCLAYATHTRRHYSRMWNREMSDEELVLEVCRQHESERRAQRLLGKTDYYNPMLHLYDGEASAAKKRLEVKRILVWILSGSAAWAGILGIAFLFSALTAHNDLAEEPESFPIHTYPAIFNRRCYGVYYYAALAVLLATFLNSVFWTLASESAFLFVRGLGFWEHLQFPSVHSLLIALFLGTLTSAAFLALSHLIRNEWVLPPAFGAFCVLSRILVILMAAVLLREGIRVQLVGSLSLNCSFFANKTLFMLGLVIAVRLWGLTLWSLMFGTALGRLTYHIVSLVFEVGAPLSVTHICLSPLSSYGAIVLMWSISGLVTGALILIGIRLHLRQKGFRLRSSTITLSRRTP